MDKYKDMICPVCGLSLEDGEVCVCPECGAPHHRECFLQNGKCFYDNAHGTPEQWTIPQEKEKAQHHVCPNCGMHIDINDEDNRFCPKCGIHIKKDGDYQDTQSEYAQQGDDPLNDRVNIFFSSNGFDKNEDINGFKLQRIAEFVGVNALRYVRIFRDNIKRRVFVRWNWAAFLLPTMWLFSRKCFKTGCISAAFDVFTMAMCTLALPSNYQQIMQSNEQMAEFMGSEQFMTLAVVEMLMISVRVLFGLFGDWIYRRKVFSALSELKKEGIEDSYEIYRKGGVNFFLAGAAYFVTGILANLLILLFG